MTAIAMPYAAERAAAYTVAALFYGATVQEVSTYNPEDSEYWLPWAAICPCSSCCGDVSSSDWHDIAILAAEIIALRPEIAGHGPRWDSIELEGREIAIDLASRVPDRSDPLYGIGFSICGDWWAPAQGNERRLQMEKTGAKILDLWREAGDLVKGCRPQIDALAKVLQDREYLERDEVQDWWVKCQMAPADLLADQSVDHA